MRYYIIAGEASGDLHASKLMRGLKACDPQCDFRYWGGDAMAAEGGTLVRHYRDTAVMGVVEVLAKAPKLLRNISFCKRDILAYKPDALILVDYPGFNLRIAGFARRHGIKVLYYIAPKVWAHKERRVEKLRRDVDVLYCIFPFELEWFRSRGIEPRYFGNPLLDSLGQWQESPLEKCPRIALLPGSRQAELKFLMPRFARLEKMLAADPRFAGYRLTVAAAPSMREDDIKRYLPADSKMEIVKGRTYDVLASSEAAVISSGTASLEAALIGVPQVVCYGVNPLTYAIVWPTLKIPYVSLANLSLGRLIFPELIQKDAEPEKIFAEIEKILADGRTAGRMKEDYQQLRTVMGGAGASLRTAKDMYEKLAHI